MFSRLQSPSSSAIVLSILLTTHTVVDVYCLSPFELLWWPQQQTFISDSSGSWEAQDQDLVGGDSLLGFQMTIFLLCTHKRNHLSLVPFTRALISFNRVPPHHVITSQRPTSLYHHIGVRIAIYKLGRGGGREGKEGLAQTFILCYLEELEKVWYL